MCGDFSRTISTTDDTKRDPWDRYRTPAPTSPHPRGAPRRRLPGLARRRLPRRRRRDASAFLPSHHCGHDQSRQLYIMSREGSPTREVTPSSGLRGSMDSLFSKASSSIQSAAQSAAQAVQDTAQSVARSPARRRRERTPAPRGRLLLPHRLRFAYFMFPNLGRKAVNKPLAVDSEFFFAFTRTKKKIGF